MNSLVNGECREEDIVFRTVLNISAVVFSYLGRGDRVVVDLTRDGVVFSTTVGERFEEGCAT